MLHICPDEQLQSLQQDPDDLSEVVQISSPQISFSLQTP